MTATTKQYAPDSLSAPTGFYKTELSLADFRDLLSTHKGISHRSKFADVMQIIAKQQLIPNHADYPSFALVLGVDAKDYVIEFNESAGYENIYQLIENRFDDPCRELLIHDVAFWHGKPHENLAIYGIDGGAGKSQDQSDDEPASQVNDATPQKKSVGHELLSQLKALMLKDIPMIKLKYNSLKGQS